MSWSTEHHRPIPLLSLVAPTEAPGSAMPIPTREMIDTFISITGASESVALQKLEEYGGNLNAAVSAHFLETERNMTNQSVIPVPRQHNSWNSNNQSLDANPGILPLLSSIRSFRPSLLLDPNYRRSLINRIGSSSFNTNTMQSPAGEAWRFPLQNDQVNVPPYYPDPSIHRNVTRDSDSHLDNDRESEMLQAAIEASKREERINHTDRQSGLSNIESEMLQAAIEASKCEREINQIDRQSGLSNIESEMLQAAIEASKREREINHRDRQFGLCNVEEDYQEEEDVARAISMSLKTAEEDDNKRAPKLEKEFGCLKTKQEPGATGSSCLQIESEMLQAAIEASKREGEINHTDRQSGQSNVFEKELKREDTFLSPEPAVNNDNALSLIVKMPDGTRHARRFLKSDKLKFLFNFIDAGKGVKPGTYSLVRPYPRQAFGVADSHLSLQELGLTGKQEALFLEFM